MFTLIEASDGSENDETAQTKVECLDKGIWAKEGGIPMRVHAHDQVKGNEGKDEGIGQDVEGTQNRHPALAPLEVLITPSPTSVEKGTNSSPLPGPIQFEAQGIIEIDQAERIKKKEADQVSPKKKGQVKPDLFSAKIFVQPGKKIGSP